MNRRQVAAILEKAVKAQYGPDAQLGPINWGDSHRRAMAWNRRYERAQRRSLRNQPPAARA